MRWKVPITIATKNNPEAVKIVLEEESTTVTVDGGVDPGDYILVREGFKKHVTYTCHYSHTLPHSNICRYEVLSYESDVVY